NFRIEFPTGTKVTDYIERKIYTVGVPAQDEQAAIQAFLREEGLSAESSTSGRGRWLKQAAVTSSGIVVVGLLIWFVGRRWLRRGLALLCFALLFASPTLRSADIDRQGNWVVSHAPGETIHVSQCGWNISMLALEYFRVPYDMRKLQIG